MKRCLMLLIACGLLLVASSSAQARGLTFSSGSALTFIGTNSYVSVPLASPPASNYTLSAWVYLRAGGQISGERMAVFSSPTCGGSVEFLIRSITEDTADPQYLELGRCGDFNGSSSTSAVPLDSWTHLAVTVSDTKMVSYYLNGNQAGTWSAAGQNVGMGSTIHLGDNITRKFNGMLDEVQIWTNTLTQAEIQTNMNRRLVGDEPGLYVYFPMDEYGGGVVTDAAAAGGVATGTLNNGATWTSETTFIPSVGTANRFPSPIMVSGVTNGVSRMAVKLTGLAHTYPSDLDVLLVNPAGQSILLMSDVSNDMSVTNLSLRFDDAATAHLPANGGGGIVSGAYRPTDYFTGESFPAPAPAGPYTTTNLATLLSGATNGVWSLYIVDGSAGDQGSLQGWSITFFPTNDGGPTILVSTNGSHQVPYSTWATAATNIQAAIDFADEGDTVLVSNGVYETGGRAAPGSTLTNRVFIDIAIEVRSVNGAEFTTIRGNGTNVAANVVRCVWMANDATLVGFTLTQGATQNSDRNGGGLLAQSTSAVVSSCVLVSNIANYFGTGGGAFQGTLNNCTLSFNRCIASWGKILGLGGGAAYSTLNNCTLSGNSASLGGGAYESTLNNCTLTGNSAEGDNAFGNSGGGAAYSALNNCTLTGNSAKNTNTIDSAGGGAAYSTLSNCTVSGNSAEWGGGASECRMFNCIVYFNTALIVDNNYYYSTINYTCTTPLPPSGTGNISSDPLFEKPYLGYYQLRTNSPCRNAGNNAYAPGLTDRDGDPRVVNGIVDMGAYEIQPTPADGTVHYVNLNSTNPVWPHATWATAAINIQDAIVAADVGDTVLVSNGVYQAGGYIDPEGGYPSRVVIDEPIKIRSVNGPAVTTIRGSGPIGAGSVRCVWMTNGVTLVGFTFTNGATQGGGGGLRALPLATVSNCVLTGNTAALGGGSMGGVLNNCLFVGNSSDIDGGGALQGTLNNCTLSGNSAGGQGGGAADCTLNNCTLSGNSSALGSAATFCTLNNSIAYFNIGGNYSFDCTFSYSCTTPLPAGTGNISSDPQFVNAGSGNLRLLATSPSINSGNNANAPGATDLDGNARFVGATVDMGAYEYNQLTANYDSDADGFTDVEEYISDTQPTNGASYFPDVQLTDVPVGELALVIDQSSVGRIYGVFANTNLLQEPQNWTLVPPEQTGTASSLTLTITNTWHEANYRTGVRLP